MNKKVRQFVISNDWIISSIDFLMRIKNKNKFIKRVAENWAAEIFDVDTLAKEIPLYPVDKVIDNNFYGLSYTLKKYVGVEFERKLNASIEHGLFSGPFVREDDFLYNVDSIITFGNYRQRMLKNKLINKRIIMIGPYIHYANLVLSDQELCHLKGKLGKILLVFPSHSVKDIQAKYNETELINEIERIRAGFDNVLICLFWRDVCRKDLLEQYKQKGYLFVSAGHIHDINFLSRLKTIISLADITMSNSVGTHIGYCVYMNKPHYVYNQDIILREQRHSAIKRELGQRTTEELEEAISDERLLASYFSTFGDVISMEQKRIVEDYWGISYVCSPQELLHLIF